MNERQPYSVIRNAVIVLQEWDGAGLHIFELAKGSLRRTMQSRPSATMPFNGLSGCRHRRFPQNGAGRFGRSNPETHGNGGWLAQDLNSLTLLASEPADPRGTRHHVVLQADYE